MASATKRKCIIPRGYETQLEADTVDVSIYLEFGGENYGFGVQFLMKSTEVKVLQGLHLAKMEYIVNVPPQPIANDANADVISISSDDEGDNEESSGEDTSSSSDDDTAVPIGETNEQNFHDMEEGPREYLSDSDVFVLDDDDDKMNGRNEDIIEVCDEQAETDDDQNDQDNDNVIDNDNDNEDDSDVSDVSDDDSDSNDDNDDDDEDDGDESDWEEDNNALQR